GELDLLVRGNARVSERKLQLRNLQDAQRADLSREEAVLLERKRGARTHAEAVGEQPLLAPNAQLAQAIDVSGHVSFVMDGADEVPTGGQVEPGIELEFEIGRDVRLIDAMLDARTLERPPSELGRDLEFRLHREACRGTQRHRTQRERGSGAKRAPSRAESAKSRAQGSEPRMDHPFPRLRTVHRFPRMRTVPIWPRTPYTPAPRNPPSPQASRSSPRQAASIPRAGSSRSPLHRASTSRSSFPRPSVESSDQERASAT